MEEKEKSVELVMKYMVTRSDRVVIGQKRIDGSDNIDKCSYYVPDTVSIETVVRAHVIGDPWEVQLQTKVKQRGNPWDSNSALNSTTKAPRWVYHPQVCLYLYDADKMCKYGVIDIDSNEKAGHSNTGEIPFNQAVVMQAQKIEQLGLPLNMVYSLGGGMHFYFFFPELLHADDVIAFLSEVRAIETTEIKPESSTSEFGQSCSLPWWHKAPPGRTQFLRILKCGGTEFYFPTDFETVPTNTVKSLAENYNSEHPRRTYVRLGSVGSGNPAVGERILANARNNIRESKRNNTFFMLGLRLGEAGFDVMTGKNYVQRLYEHLERQRQTFDFSEEEAYGAYRSGIERGRPTQQTQIFSNQVSEVEF